MRKLSRFLTCGCAAVALLVLSAGDGVALRSVQVSTPGAMRATGTRVSFEEEAGFLRLVCEGLTLNGTGNERIAKSRGAAFGSITEGRATGCRAFGFEATVTVEAEPRAPFSMTYSGILGTLPNITGILTFTEGITFTLISIGRTCRYGGRAGMLFEVSRGSMERGNFLGEPRLSIQPGSTSECPSEDSLRGSMRFERARTVTLV
jgi:hypothetical protein